MASPRLGWASRSLMRAHREKPLGAGGGDGFAENSSAPGRSWAKAEFHTSPRPPKHGRGPESRLCPRGSPWDGSPWDGWHAEGHCLGRQLGKASAASRGLTRVTAMFPAAPSWSPPPKKIFPQPNPCGAAGHGGSRNGAGCSITQAVSALCTWGSARARCGKPPTRPVRLYEQISSST